MRKKDIVEFCLQAVYPRRCPVCHDIVRPKGALVCRGCEGKVMPIREPRCRKCGKPVEKEEQEYCSDCRKHRHFFEEGAGIFPYNRLMRESLMKCKYGGRREYLDYYGEMMIRHGGKYLARWRPQAIVPIPLHKTQMRLRGFNQSLCLAQALGGHFGIPVYPQMLEKVRKTRTQKSLDEKQRRSNLRGAFSIGAQFQPLKKILLVDDVYTTGGTVDEAARCLKKAKAGEVRVLVLCIGKGF